MADTYCGKSCAECTRRESLNCPGCQTGPGRFLNGDCVIASCCRDKGHETCFTCTYHGNFVNCIKYSRRQEIPEDFLRKQKEEQRKKERLAKQAPVLGKWLWILFWLFIPAEVSGIMASEILEQVLALNLSGNILSVACDLVYALILLKLAREEYMYHTAGVCALICAAANVLVLIFFDGQTDGWANLITLPAGVFGFVGMYHEFQAHSTVVHGIDPGLSEKWTKLWTWYWMSIAAMFGSLVVMLLSVTLGVIVILAAAAVVLVVGILKLVYLYRTARVFRTYDPAK